VKLLDRSLQTPEYRWSGLTVLRLQWQRGRSSSKRSAGCRRCRLRERL